MGITNQPDGQKKELRHSKYRRGKYVKTTPKVVVSLVILIADTSMTHPIKISKNLNVVL